MNTVKTFEEYKLLIEKDEDIENKKFSGKVIAKKMRKFQTMDNERADKVEKMKTITYLELDKMLPDYVAGGDIWSLFTESNNDERFNEAKRSDIFKAAKKGSYPAVIVVVENGEVIHQEPVDIPVVAPAKFNVTQEKYPNAKLHLEDKTGKILFTESNNV